MDNLGILKYEKIAELVYKNATSPNKYGLMKEIILLHF